MTNPISLLYYWHGNVATDLSQVQEWKDAGLDEPYGVLFTYYTCKVDCNSLSMACKALGGSVPTCVETAGLTIRDPAPICDL